MTFPVEIVLKGRHEATTETLLVSHGDPATWDDGAVRDVLVEILRAINRAQDAETARDQRVVLQGFSWIVEPAGAKVVLAIEIPMGAAVAGPFAIPQDRFEAAIGRVLRDERQQLAPNTVH
jgi:hypothetical protein